jgi:RND family efflux transporter MFP subunit
MRDSARVELEIAQRELDWATVKAPADGTVLKLLARPGDVVGPEAHGLASIYDPDKLQARVDVPLASMKGVRVGQEVEVSSEVLGASKTRGQVLRIQRESDLLKNTLQVKVQLIDPDPLLRPETLCRARFLAPEEQESGAIELFRVPAAAVRGSAVYILDPSTGRARRVPVEEVGRQNGDVVVRGALSITQEVILDEVEADQRVERKS